MPSYLFFGKVEEWDFDDEIQDAEMVPDKPRKKKPIRKKTKKQYELILTTISI